MRPSGTILTLVVLCVAVAGLAVPASGTADGGTPTEPTTTTPAPQPQPTLPILHHYSNTVPVLAQYGPVCVHGKCRYLPISGTVITVSTPSGKVLKRFVTNTVGRVNVVLPKGTYRVNFSHAPLHGIRFGTWTSTWKYPVDNGPYVTAPPPFVFTFHTSRD